MKKILILCLCILALTGCEFLAYERKIATTPDATGHSPIENIGSGGVGVAINPANWSAWSQILAGVSTLIVGAYGYKKYKAHKNGK